MGSEMCIRDRFVKGQKEVGLEITVVIGISLGEALNTALLTGQALNS